MEIKHIHGSCDFCGKTMKNEEGFSGIQNNAVICFSCAKKLLTEVKIIKYKNMNIKEKFVLAITKEPQKSFRKVEVTNGDDILTEDGQKVFLSWLLHTKYADDFKKEVVDDMLKDLEEKK